MPTASSACLKAEVERASLLAKAAALSQKQDTERQEAELKAKREALDLQTAASDAKLKVLENYENEHLSHVSAGDRWTLDSGYLLLPASQNPVSDMRNGHGEFRPLQLQFT